VSAYFLSQSLNPLRRATRFDVIGQVQLWSWPYPQSENKSREPRVQSRFTFGTDWSRSKASTTKTIVGASVQTDPRGRQAVVTTSRMPPLLVCFSQEGETYRMMRVDGKYLESFHVAAHPLHVLTGRLVSMLRVELSSDRLTEVNLVSLRERSFSVEVHSVQRLESWNLYNLGARGTPKKFAQHKCRVLSLSFNDSTERDNFQHALLKLQLHALGAFEPREVPTDANSASVSVSSVRTRATATTGKASKSTFAGSSLASMQTPTTPSSSVASLPEISSLGLSDDQQCDTSVTTEPEEGQSLDAPLGQTMAQVSKAAHPAGVLRDQPKRYSEPTVEPVSRGESSQNLPRLPRDPSPSKELKDRRSRIWQWLA